MKRLIVFGSLIAGLVLTVAVGQMVTGKVKTPFQLSKDYTMANPSAAPTVATSATVATSCSSSKTYTWYTVCLNESGYTNLSPASTTWVPSPSLREASVTRTNACPSNTKGWAAVFSCDDGGGAGCDEGVTKYFANPSSNNPATSLELAFIATGTNPATVSCNQTGGALTHGSTNQTGVKKHASINDVAEARMTFPSFAGGNINLITENVRQLDLSTTLPRWSTDSGANFANLLTMTTKLVTVCASGCAYANLNAACAGETSTSANPIVYWMGPFTDTTQASCSGEDHAAFVGSGIGVTTINFDSTGDSGPFQPGTSTNWLIRDMTLNGHRGIYMDGGGTGGGAIRIDHVQFIQANTAADEDCVFLKGFVAGTTIDFQNNECVAHIDGFTIKANGANLDAVYARNNRFNYVASSGVGASAGSAYSFESSPAIVDISGDSVEANSSMVFNGAFVRYWHNVAGATTATLLVRNIYDKMNSTAGNGSSTLIMLFRAESAATELTKAYFQNVVAQISTSDTTTGQAWGYRLDNATTEVYVYGGRVRTSGGSANYDFTSQGGGGKFFIDSGADYVTTDTTPTAAIPTIGSQRGTDTFAAATTKTVTLPVAEPDANFYVSISCSANKTFWVTAKATTGFTLNASSSSSDSCDWMVKR